VQKATADAAALRAKVKAGGRGSAKISAADIAAADQAVEFAALAHEGAVAAIPALAAAEAEARANEACDEVLAELPLLGQEVTVALQTIETFLSPLVSAVERYDAFVESAVHRLEKVASAAEPVLVAGTGLNPQRRGGVAASPFVAGAESPPAEPEPAPVQRSRFTFPRHGVPTVDGVTLTSCRGPSQLAAVVRPIFEQLGAHHGLIENLKLLEAGAPSLRGPQ